jgi:hypothetical protein
MMLAGAAVLIFVDSAGMTQPNREPFFRKAD